MYQYYSKSSQNQTVISRKLITTFSCPKRGKHSQSFSVMQKVFTCPRKYPVVRGMASYALIWPVCSLVQEYVVHGTTLKNADWARAVRYGLFGCFAMAPVWHCWMKLSGKLFLTRDLSGALKRAIFEQITYSPIALALFFFGMSACENKPFRACVNEVKEKFWPTYTVGAMFWPTAQTLNFYYVSEKNRLLCVSAASFVWTIFMAHMKEKEPKMTEFELPPEENVPTVGQVVRAIKTITEPVNPIDMQRPNVLSPSTYEETINVDSDFATEKIITIESEEIVESNEATYSKNSVEVTGQATGDTTKSDYSMELQEQPTDSQDFVVTMPSEDFFGTLTAAISKDTFGPTEINTGVPTVPSEDDEDKPGMPGESGDFVSTDENKFAGYIKNIFKTKDSNVATENLDNSMVKTSQSETTYKTLDKSMQFKLRSVRGVDLLEAPIAMESENLNPKTQQDAGDQEVITHVYDIQNADERSIEKAPPNEDLPDSDDNPPEVGLPVTETVASMTGVIIEPVAPDTMSSRRCIKGCEVNEKAVDLVHDKGSESSNKDDNNNIWKGFDEEVCWLWLG